LVCHPTESDQNTSSTSSPSAASFLVEHLWGASSYSPNKGSRSGICEFVVIDLWSNV
jgi:hypothetical protein